MGALSRACTARKPTADVSKVAATKGKSVPTRRLEVKHSEEEIFVEGAVCETCGSAHEEESLLLCDSCDRGHHTFCLTPPLAEVPEGAWYCPECMQSVRILGPGRPPGRSAYLGRGAAGKEVDRIAAEQEAANTNIVQLATVPMKRPAEEMASSNENRPAQEMASNQAHPSGEPVRRRLRRHQQLTTCAG